MYDIPREYNYQPLDVQGARERKMPLPPHPWRFFSNIAKESIKYNYISLTFHYIALEFQYFSKDSFFGQC